MEGLNIIKILAGLRNPELYLRKLKQDSGIQPGENTFNSAITSQVKTNNILNNISNNIADNMANDITKNIEKNVANNVANNITKNVEKNIANNVENNITKNIEKNVLNDKLNSTAKNLERNVEKSVQKQIDSKPLPMNQIASMDRSIYVKNLLGLPQTLGEILKQAQSNIPLNSNTLILNNLNEDLIKNQKALAQIFDDMAQPNINALQNIEAQIAQTTQTVQKDAVMLIFSGMVHMPQISEMIVRNSKQAIAGLIASMASASKHGMTGEQIRETLGIINSCVAMAESGNPAQTLKSLMLLYLPWLPLNEGVGFDLEVETTDGENESIDSKLIVLIQTKNFGNVKGVFTLTTSNSVDIYIICSENFPKVTLQKSLMDESSAHAMNTTIDIEAVTPKKQETLENQEAKVNLSATNEMNPYLLLMAHAFIRNVIYIDSSGTIEMSTSGE